MNRGINFGPRSILPTGLLMAVLLAFGLAVAGRPAAAVVPLHHAGLLAHADQIRTAQARRSYRNGRSEQDRARDAVRGGDALPLDRIIGSALSACPGRFLNANLGSRGGRLVYSVRILSRAGKRATMLIDASSSAVIGGRCR